MQTKLTTTEITQMSEVMAEYMGLEISKNMYGDTYSELPNGDNIFHRHIPSWDWLHEVWEKVREENTDEDVMDDYIFIEFQNLKDKIQHFIVFGTPEQCFIALYEAIKFINQLKQENNA
jgi:hypothetical protein